MKKLAVGVAITAALLFSTPAQADPGPWDVAGKAKTGEYDAGWMRAVCSVEGPVARCNLRVPDGFSIARLSYLQGGDPVAEMTSWDKSVQYGARGKFSSRPVPGVQVSCRHKGNRIWCEVSFADRLDDSQVIWWSDGWDQGGLHWQDQS